jgi:hypothetical protein
MTLRQAFKPMVGATVNPHTGILLLMMAGLMWLGSYGCR